jgi:hypothetical protein
MSTASKFAVFVAEHNAETDAYASESLIEKKRRIAAFLADDDLTIDQRIAAEQVSATLELAEWVKDLSTTYRGEHGLL